MADTAITMYGVRVSSKEAGFLAALREGLPPAAAAAKAGYREPASTSRALLHRPHMANAVAMLQAEIADTLQVSRLRVLEMINEAYMIGKEDNNAMVIIRAAQEISKMCGYYKTVDAGASDTASNIIAAMQPRPMEALSDEKVEHMAGLTEE